MNPSLKLIFFHIRAHHVKKFKLSFSEKIENIENNELTFSIPNIVFKHGKDKATIDINLYDDLDGNQTYKFNIYYGKNYGYVQTDSLSGKVFEIIFQKMKNIKIEQFETEFKELDNLGNRDRERLTLINYTLANISINNKNIILSDIVSQNMIDDNSLFNQISILDFENNKFIVQPIKEKSEYDIDFFIINKDLLITFEKEFKKFLNSNINEYPIIDKNIRDKFGNLINHGSLDLNRDYEYLNEIFNKYSLLNLEIFWNYSLFRFFIDNKKEYLFLHRSFILSFMSNLKKIMKNIKKIKDISLYEKARTVYTLFTVISLGKKYLL